MMATARSYTYFDMPGLGLCALCAQTLHVPGHVAESSWVLVPMQRVEGGGFARVWDVTGYPHPIHYAGSRREVAQCLYNVGATPA